MEKSKQKKIAIIVGTVIILAVILGLYLGLPTDKKYNNVIFGNMSMQTIIKTQITNQGSVGNKILNSVNLIDDLTNPTKESSDIYKINHSKVNEEINVDPVTIDLLEISYDVYLKTGKKYNPASYCLVDLWGFSAEKFNPNIEHTLPQEDLIKKGIRLSEKFSDLVFIESTDTEAEIAEKKLNATFIVDKINNTVTRTEKAKDGDDIAMIDLGGISKGYAAGLCFNVFSSSNIENGLVNIAGNVYTYGRDFAVGLENPFKDNEGESNIFGVVDLKNLTVSVSGVYLRNYKIGDTLYHHIIDTTTGAPKTLSNDSIIMASVISNNGAIADALATSLVLCDTYEDAENIINKYSEEVKAVILVKGNKEYKIIGDVSFKFNESELEGFTKI